MPDTVVMGDRSGSALADPLAELQVGRDSDDNDCDYCEKGHLTSLWDLSQSQ